MEKDKKLRVYVYTLPRLDGKDDYRVEAECDGTRYASIVSSSEIAERQIDNTAARLGATVERVSKSPW